VTTEPVRAGAGWLALREPADAAARSTELVEELRLSVTTSRPLVVHDLGSGSGSMARWLAPQLPGAQHWVLHDRDTELLDLAAGNPPVAASDGSPVTTETRSGDITRLGSLPDADLVTASALLDMLTAAELERLVSTAVAAACPVLVALSVVGRVELAPSDPWDRRVAEAFNAHQRRATGAGTLLGPDAVQAAVADLTGRGLHVLVRESPWRLGAGEAALMQEWLDGWLAAAWEQEPALRAETRGYARRRREEAAAGRLSVTVHHEDLLARPR
jgi:hypothetical protein